MKIQIGEQEVEVSHKVLDNGPVEILASCGEHSHTHFVVIGEADKPLPENYGQVEAQRDLEAGRAHAAAMAASKARRKLLTDNLQ